MKKGHLVGDLCDPAAIRTRDRLLRRQMLYPAELPDRPFCFVGTKVVILFHLPKLVEKFVQFAEFFGNSVPCGGGDGYEGKA